MRHIFTDGIFAVLSRPGNIGILCFLAILGMMVQLLNKTGGSRVFGNWAQEQIKTRKASMFATMLLGCLIFIDDYFNCLTVGSVMLPVSDKARVSRAKLALIFLQVDFGPMAVHERNAVKGDLFTTLERPYGTEEGNKGKEETFLCNRNALFRRILLRYRFCDRFFSIGCADRSRTGVFFRFALYTRVLFYTACHFFYRSNGVFTGRL